MKLEKILDRLNSFEKNSFLKIIDNILTNTPKNSAEINKILSDSSNDLKTVDHINIARVLDLVEYEFEAYVRSEFANTASQLDILSDIIIRDGNCIMKQEWFAQLYHAELKKLCKNIKKLKFIFEDDNPDIEDSRKRDYIIYRACLKTAFNNDLAKNQDSKITDDEQSILHTLAEQLDLSQEEIKLINYQIIPVEKSDIDRVINDLKNMGIIFYSKKNNTVYVADEIVRILRKVREKEIADKFFRRVLLNLREPQINLICKKHNIDWRQPLSFKIKEIINEGIPFTTVLTSDIYKDGTKVTDKKKLINDLCDRGLCINPSIKGITLNDKIENIKKYFEDLERDDKVNISFDGYEKLLIDIARILPKTNTLVKEEFELQDEHVLNSDYLLDYNIKPRDVLDIMENESLLKFCEVQNIKTRGDVIVNILDTYKDTENLNLENYENIGFRNLSTLKENGILIKEADLGVKFEDLTKLIFSKLGFNVDEGLRKKLNTNKNKIDIVLNLGKKEIILVECKTVKESGYNKFSSVSRQLKAYADLVKLNDHKVIKSLLVAPDFSDEFVNECELEYELNLSLIKASSLKSILDGFKSSKHKSFPYKLLMRDVLIQEDRIIKAINR